MIIQTLLGISTAFDDSCGSPTQFTEIAMPRCALRSEAHADQRSDQLVELQSTAVVHLCICPSLPRWLQDALLSHGLVKKFICWLWLFLYGIYGILWHK